MQRTSNYSPRLSARLSARLLPHFASQAPISTSVDRCRHFPALWRPTLEPAPRPSSPSYDSRWFQARRPVSSAENRSLARALHLFRSTHLSQFHTQRSASSNFLMFGLAP